MNSLYVFKKFYFGGKKIHLKRDLYLCIFTVLCGPPGSGKTMTLFSALRALPDMEVVGLNFSSATTPELLLKTFDHYCEYRKTPNGVILAPIQVRTKIIEYYQTLNFKNTYLFSLASGWFYSVTK